MNNMIEDCPFCGTEIIAGAVVCRGCQAEKVQPRPGCFTYFVVFILSFCLAGTAPAILDALFDIHEDTRVALSLFLLVVLIIPTFRYVEKELKKRGFRTARWQRRRHT